jgi:hypothetical protein
MSGAGRLDGIGPLWLQRVAQESARAAGDLWVPVIESPVELMLTQAVPISAWDQGPLVAAGVPAFGIGGIVPAEADQLNWDTYHTPQDTVEYQSAATLGHSGRVVEATVRQLLTMDEFPEESGPYVYFGTAGTALRGPALWLIFILLVGLFFAGSLRVSYRPLADSLAGWRNGLPHFLSIWLPWVASALLLYLFVEVGLMEGFAKYPALAKDPIIFNPRWPAVILYLLGLGLFFWLGRKAAARSATIATFRERKSLALFVVGLAALYILIKNPFSLLFLLPVLVWFFIGGRRHLGWWLDGLLFLLGGLVLYVLLYFFGALFLRNGFAVLWYVLMMFSIRMVGFWTMAVITAVVAAGLSLVVQPAVPAPQEQEEPSSVVMGRA